LLSEVPFDLLRGHELGEPDEDHGSSLNCREREGGCRGIQALR
jgi:hypothetical protein